MTPTALIFSTGLTLLAECTGATCGAPEQLSTGSPVSPEVDQNLINQNLIVPGGDNPDVIKIYPGQSIIGSSDTAWRICNVDDPTKCQEIICLAPGDHVSCKQQFVDARYTLPVCDKKLELSSVRVTPCALDYRDASLIAQMPTPVEPSGPPMPVTVTNHGPTCDPGWSAVTIGSATWCAKELRAAR